MIFIELLIEHAPDCATMRSRQRLSLLFDSKRTELELREAAGCPCPFVVVREATVTKVDIKLDEEGAK